MEMVLHVAFLICLVKLLVETEKPFLCAVIYVALKIAIMFMFSQSLLYVVVAVPVSFGLAWLYFWLLNRFFGSVWFWVVMIGGLAIGIV
jgi:hypothetical protein